MPEDKKKEEDELIPVGEGADKPAEELEEELEEEKKKETDDTEGEEEDEDLDDGEDEERLGASDDDDEDDVAKKKRRRTERKTRRQRQKEARGRDKTELNFLRTRNETLERKFSELDERVGHSETAQVDNRINDIRSKIKLADQVISKAISSQDGDAYSEAQGIRDGLRDDLSKLNYVKQTIEQRGAPGDQPDPAMVSHARNFVQDNPWWDPDGKDKDSRAVSRIDAQLAREGLDPRTPEYWEELSDRVEEKLPHRFINGEDDDDADDKPGKKKKKKSKGPTFSTGGRERPLKKGEVYVSPERRQAMEEAGVWEDPELRQRYLAQYAKYDRENRSNA